MSIGRKATLNAAKVLATTGLDLLTDPDFLKAVGDDFVKQLNGRSYESLNDFETSPLGKLDTAETQNYDCCIHAAMEHFGIKEHQS
jgi:aminobenzoyl-glutamate utilization protein B